MLYEIEVETIDGQRTTLEKLQGHVALVVNTASACGFTPQFAGLESLHKKYSPQGLVVLGFPCNQFGAQDPGSNEEIGAFCVKNFGVSFQMHAKIDVNGSDTHPLFAHLKKAAPGLLGSEAIKWNFTKFLINRKGEVVKRYAPQTSPDAIAADIEAELAR